MPECIADFVRRASATPEPVVRVMVESAAGVLPSLSNEEMKRLEAVDWLPRDAIKAEAHRRGMLQVFMMGGRTAEEAVPMVNIPNPSL